MVLTYEFTHDRTSQHVTSEPEVLPVAEEPGHAEVNDEWSDDVLQDLVGDLSEWSADVLNALSCVFSDFNDNTLQPPVCVATDLSVDIPQATVFATSDYRVPVRDVADYRANFPRVLIRDVAYYRANLPRVPVPVEADCSVDVPQVPVSTTSAPVFDVVDCCSDVSQVLVCASSDCRVDIHHESVRLTEDTVSPQSQLEDYEIIDINSCSYEIGRKLGEGSFGNVYAGIRMTDGLKVALKFADNMGIEWLDIEGCPEPVPTEIGLLILANKGPRVPQIIQLLDWEEEPKQYIMVLERPVPCEDLVGFLDRHKGTIEEDVASVIMQQATLAAQTCCQRGVLHRDIKLENLLINPNTLEVKLIDFGCGEILINEGYTSFSGTREYCPPEYDINGEYHGEPATVWSLGILLFTLLCGKFPESEDLEKLNDNIWTKDGLSQECCELLCSCLQTDPEQRIEMKNVNLHNWFIYFNY
ncbi:serine/threonine-protein kinase pim-2-like [Rhinichthys klamathensis goyatoka]|uniref:serine/threonine-protein kinase pim-2-like n=1 Tax=Rhinichthys klamathensis goyatoka TaxID=3034132 RepID=UPI0024B4DA6B|nr:serine/threonine-protein kinase pim-2-like [Rhinichthys klamathensis goyatoka]